MGARRSDAFGLRVREGLHRGEAPHCEGGAQARQEGHEGAEREGADDPRGRDDGLQRLSRPQEAEAGEDPPADEEAEEDADRGGDESDEEGFAQEEGSDLAAGRADRAQKREFARPLREEDAEGRGDDDRGDDDGDDREDEEHDLDPGGSGCEVLEGLFARLVGGLDLEVLIGEDGGDALGKGLEFGVRGRGRAARDEEAVGRGLAVGGSVEALGRHDGAFRTQGRMGEEGGDGEGPGRGVLGEGRGDFEGVADGHAETGGAHFVEGDLPGGGGQGSRRGRGRGEGRRHERLHHEVGARPVLREEEVGGGDGGDGADSFDPVDSGDEGFEGVPPVGVGRGEVVSGGDDDRGPLVFGGGDAFEDGVHPVAEGEEGEDEGCGDGDRETGRDVAARMGAQVRAEEAVHRAASASSGAEGARRSARIRPSRMTRTRSAFSAAD